MQMIADSTGRASASESLNRAVAEKADRILRINDVRHRTGLGRSTIYDWMKAGEFPQPVKLGARMVGWRESEIDAWLAARERRAA